MSTYGYSGLLTTSNTPCPIKKRGSWAPSVSELRDRAKCSTAPIVLPKTTTPSDIVYAKKPCSKTSNGTCKR